MEEPLHLEKITAMHQPTDCGGEPLGWSLEVDAVANLLDGARPAPELVPAGDDAAGLDSWSDDDSPNAMADGLASENDRVKPNGSGGGLPNESDGGQSNENDSGFET